MTENLEAKTKVGLPLTLVENGTFQDAKYTVDEAVNFIGYGCFQIRLTILSGLGWMADAFEIIILSIIGEFVSCDWEISRWQNAVLTSSVFAGMMLGSPIFGTVADKFGRKTSLSVSLSLLFVFGAISAGSPSYGWMLAFRGCTGFALGGIAQALTLCCEYVPTHMRGRAGFYLCYFWAIGTIGVILFSWIVMTTTDNWRILLAVAAIPSLIVVISLKWYPESARFYIVSNKFEQAQKVLQEMATMNKKFLPPGQLMPVTQCENRGCISDLLSADYRLTTLLFWYMWTATAFSYYGIALMSPLIIQNGSVKAIADQRNNSINYFDDLYSTVPCVKMTQQDFFNLLWTSAAELPGVIAFTFLVELLDRKKLLCGSCVISSILVLLLLLDMEEKTWYLIILFGARAIILAMFQLTLVMTSEAFPTTLRAVAMGTGSSFSRLGGLVSPYVAQILMVNTPSTAIYIQAAVLLLGSVIAMFLPLETRGMELLESHTKREKSKPVLTTSQQPS